VMHLKVVKEDLVVVKEEAIAGAATEEVLVVAKEKAMAVVKEEVQAEAEDVKAETLVADSEISLENHVKAEMPVEVEEEKEAEAETEDAGLNLIPYN